MPTLYQAEWCPFSSAVRELLTEHGIDFVAKQVPPWPEDREELRRGAGGPGGIPPAVDDAGAVPRGTGAIFGYAASLPAWEPSSDHRQRFVDHEDARRQDAVGQLLEGATEQAPDSGEPEVSNNPDGSRYE